MSSTSDIRVSVQWTNSTAFAGENIECKITFTNVSSAHIIRRSPSLNSQLRGLGLHRDQRKDALPLRPGPNPSSSSNWKLSSNSGTPPVQVKTHRQALSLGAHYSLLQSPIVGSQGVVSKSPSLGENKHRRSVSIVSIGSETIEERPIRGQVGRGGQPSRGHARAASLQVLPNRAGTSGKGPSSGSPLIPVNRITC